jgi:hypothetical protein
VNARLGHSIDRISITPTGIREGTLGGDKSGDAGQGPSLLAQDAGPPPAQPAAQPVGATYNPVTAPAGQTCGGFEWRVAWGLQGANSSTNGFLVQRVVQNFQRFQCEDRADVGWSSTYWEAWQVDKGQVVGKSGLPGVDTFRVGPGPDTFGLSYEEGFAKYIDGYTAPNSWRTLPQAGSGTWATTTMPPGWSDAGTIHRWLRSEYNCCYGNADSDLTSSARS